MEWPIQCITTWPKGLILWKRVWPRYWRWYGSTSEYAPRYAKLLPAMSVEAMPMPGVIGTGQEIYPRQTFPSTMNPEYGFNPNNVGYSGMSYSNPLTYNSSMITPPQSNPGLGYQNFNNPNLVHNYHSNPGNQPQQAQYMRWSYLDDDGVFKEYTQRNCNLIEEAYQKRTQKINIDSGGGNQYLIDLQSMSQKRPNTSNTLTRTIRRDDGTQMRPFASGEIKWGWERY